MRTKRQELDAILTVAPDQTRAEILAALLLAGKPGAPLIKGLDLAPKQDEAAGGGVNRTASRRKAARPRIWRDRWALSHMWPQGAVGA